MGLRRTSHAVYDSQYSLVWAPKYRKWILGGDLRAYVDKLFHRHTTTQASMGEL